MEPAEVILCVQQSWHSHVPLKENWPSCTAFLMESPRDQCSLSSSKGAQTINQYPTALRKWVSLKEEDLMGLFAFPLPIHLALCKLSERWIVVLLPESRCNTELQQRLCSGSSQAVHSQSFHGVQNGGLGPIFSLWQHTVTWSILQGGKGLGNFSWTSKVAQATKWSTKWHLFCD